MRGPSFARALRACSGAHSASISVYVAAICSVLFFLLLLFALAVITDLLVTHGNLEVSPEEQAAIAEWAGHPQVDQPRVTPMYVSRGMLPMVARMGDSWLGRRMQTAYRNVAILRSTELCLIAMVCSAAVLAALECLALSLLERSAKATAMVCASDLRSKIRTQAFRLGGSDVLGRAGADPVRLFTESVDQVRKGLVAWWTAWPRAPLMIGLLLSLALALQFWIAMSAILLAILLWSLGTWLAGSSKQDQAVLEDRAGKQMAALVEGLRQAPVVAGYQLEDTPGAPFGESLERHRKAALAAQTRTSNGRPLLRFAVLAGACVVLGLVGVNVFSDPPRTTVSEAVLLYAALFCAVSAAQTNVPTAAGR